MNLLVLTRAVKIDHSCIPESGIPERALVKKSYGRSLALTPAPPPRYFLFFCSRPFALSPRSKRLEKARFFAIPEQSKVILSLVFAGQAV